MTQTATKNIKDYIAIYRLTPTALTIQIKKTSSNYMFVSNIPHNQMPANLINIFDDTKDLFEYLTKNNKALVDFNPEPLTLSISVPSPTGKLRTFQIPLVQTLIGKEELLQRELAVQKGLVEKLTQKIQHLQQIIVEQIPQNMQKLIKESMKGETEKMIKQLFQQYNLRILKIETQMQKPKPKRCNKPKTTDNMPIAHLQTQTLSSAITKPASIPTIAERIQYFKNKSGNSLSETDTKQLEAYFKTLSSPVQPVQCNTSPLVLKVSPQMIYPPRVSFVPSIPSTPQIPSTPTITSIQAYSPFYFDIDQSNKFLTFFSIVGNMITRKYDDNQLFQIYSSQCIPKVGKFKITFKINVITEGLMWFGLIPENKKSQQYIGEESENIRFGCAAGKQFFIDGKNTLIQLQEIKSNSLLAMTVQLSNKKIKFYKDNNPTPIARGNIPESMLNKKIYPYFQMMAKNDSLTLSSNSP